MIRIFRPAGRCLALAPFRAAFILALVPFLGLAAGCARGPIAGWPWAERAPSVEAMDAPASPPAPVGYAIAVRVKDEAEKDALSLAAHVNEALVRHGFRPDATAGAALVLRFDRPRTLSVRGDPGVGIFGGGGSSGTTNLGVAIQIPLGRGVPPPAIGRHEIIAELENAAGKIVWRERAAMDAEAGPGIDPRVARELLGRVVGALARQAEVQKRGSAQ